MSPPKDKPAFHKDSQSISDLLANARITLASASKGEEEGHHTTHWDATVLEDRRHGRFEAMVETSTGRVRTFGNSQEEAVANLRELLIKRRERRETERQQKIIQRRRSRSVHAGIAALIIIALAAPLLLWMRQGRDLAAVGLEPALAVSQALARETVGLTGGQGNVVLIVAEGKAQPRRVTQAQIQSFRKFISTGSRLRLKAIEQVPTQSPIPGGVRRDLGMSLSVFNDICQRHSQAAAIVFLNGVPIVKKEELDSLATGRSPVLAFSPIIQGVKPLLKKGIIQSVILPRWDSIPPRQKDKESPEDIFQRCYRVVGKSQADSLPD
jgi:hypothetical protein